MRGLFHYYGDDTDNPRLIATVTDMSERERSAFSKSIHTPHGNNRKERRRISCFVFDDHIPERDNCTDFVLTVSDGTAFIDTRTSLSPGQTITMLFPASNDQGSIQVLGEVIWIGSRTSAHDPDHSTM